MRVLPAAVGIAAVLALLVLAHDAPALEQGARVRVTVIAREAPRVQGRFLGLQSDSLVVVAEPDTLPSFIARLEVRKLEVSRGMHSNAGRFATIGGIVLGVAFGSIAYTDVQDSEITGGGVAVISLGAAAVGGLVGAGLGGLIGSMSHAERWHEIRVNK